MTPESMRMVTGLESPSAEPPVSDVIRDEALGVLIDAETGEVLGAIEEEPKDATELGMWLGERIGAADARAEALRAAKAAWQARLDGIYDQRIREAERAACWLRTNPAYLAPLRNAALLVCANTRKASAIIGLVTCRFVRSRASVEITDQEAALSYLREACPEAIRTREDILKSAIAPEVLVVLGSLGEDGPKDTGIRLHPAGEVTVFEVR